MSAMSYPISCECRNISSLALLRNPSSALFYDLQRQHFNTSYKANLANPETRVWKETKPKPYSLIYTFIPKNQKPINYDNYEKAIDIPLLIPK